MRVDQLADEIAWESKKSYDMIIKFIEKGRIDIMQTVTLSQINEKVKLLPPEKLEVVFDFVSYLVDQRMKSESFQTMLASEAVLRRDWDRPEEDEAWADL